MMYAVFQDGKQVSKAHSSKEAARAEAFGLGLVIYYGGQNWLLWGVEIKEVEQ